MTASSPEIAGPHEPAIAGPHECCEHIGKTRGCENHDHDLVQELSIRLDAIWRHDQYIANAAGHDNLRPFWKQLKDQDQENIKRLKKLIAEAILRQHAPVAELSQSDETS